MLLAFGLGLLLWSAAHLDLAWFSGRVAAGIHATLPRGAIWEFAPYRNVQPVPTVVWADSLAAKQGWGPSIQQAWHAWHNDNLQLRSTVLGLANFAAHGFLKLALPIHLVLVTLTAWLAHGEVRRDQWIRIFVPSIYTLALTPALVYWCMCVWGFYKAIDVCGTPCTTSYSYEQVHIGDAVDIYRYGWMAVVAGSALLYLFVLFIASRPRLPFVACARCSYDLSKLVASRCPECGSSTTNGRLLRFWFSRRRLVQTLWLLAIASLLAGPLTLGWIARLIWTVGYGYSYNPPKADNVPPFNWYP